MKNLQARIEKLSRKLGGEFLVSIEWSAGSDGKPYWSATIQSLRGFGHKFLCTLYGQNPLKCLKAIRKDVDGVLPHSYATIPGKPSRRLGLRAMARLAKEANLTSLQATFYPADAFGAARWSVCAQRSWNYGCFFSRFSDGGSSLEAQVSSALSQALADMAA